jgi:amino acid adenylation domain-containing protein
VTDAVDYDPFGEAALEQVIPATASQKEIWAATRFHQDAACAFNESVSLCLRGPLDATALRRALGHLVRRHEALRGTFTPDDCRMCIASQGRWPLEVEELSALPSSSRLARVQEVRNEEVERPFDLERGPLARARLLVLDSQESWLVLTLHHMVCDGWSMAVLLHDLGISYSAEVSGSAAAGPPPQAFSAFARWNARQADDHRARQYWLDQLSGELPVLQLPTDRPRPPLRTFRADRYDDVLSPVLVEGLKKLGARSNASFFTVLLSAYVVFLYRLTGQQDLIVGVPAAGQAGSGMQQVVGHCVQLLPIRCGVDGAASFRQCLQLVRGQVLGAYDHQQATFGEIFPLLKVRRDQSRPPVVSTAFNLDQAVQGKDVPLAGLQVEVQSNPRRFENFEWFVNAAETKDRVVLECQYNADLFDADTLRDRMTSFSALLHGIVARPDEAVAQLPLLDHAQQEKILVQWNATARDYPRDLTVAQMLHEQATKMPDQPALTCAGTTLSYRELDRRANRLAHYLVAQGVGPGMRVGLCMDRSVELIVGLLALLKTGAAYVPLDPRYPRERLGFVLDNARAAWVLTQDQWLPLFAAASCRTLCPAREAAALAALPEVPPPCTAGPQDIAYVIYTSGSTGTPKGVAVVNQGVVNLLSDMRRQPGIGERDTLVAVTTLAFDMSITELLLPFSVGAHVILAPEEATGDGRRLLQLLQQHGATIMQGTPATWRLLVQAGWQGNPRLTAWCGGEALPPDLARDLLVRADALWNLYGPTETTVYSTGGRVLDADQIDIGRPLANTVVYLLDAQGQPVPVGVQGELYIGGAGVAAGYLHNADLTAQRFVDNPYHDPFQDYPNPRLYRTGDLARWKTDGTIDYLGRNDHQVKLRGVRIELGEIEAVLGRQAGVRQGVVSVRTERSHDPRLVAYFVPAEGVATTATELRKQLRQWLPEYMVPQHFVELDALPLTANGKVDRGRLPAPFAGIAEARRDQPLTPAARYVLRVCREALGDAAVGLDDNFFQVGGHSLLAMEILLRFEKDTGVRLTPAMLVLHTLGAIAGLLPADRIPAIREAGTS